jgi:hypothetical protein
MIAGALLTLHPGTGLANDDFEDAVQSACAEAAAFSNAHLLDMARAAYSNIERAASRRRCDHDHPVEQLIADLRVKQHARARAIELARLYRLAATQTNGRAAARWRKRAYEKYLAGLRLDPLGDGARAGLRHLLVGHPSDATGAHCRRSQDLLAVHLLWEARLELARGMTSGAEPGCRRAQRALVRARTRAYRRVHRGLAAERAGDSPRARAQYIQALASDPAAVGARAGLHRTRPPLPTEADPSAVVLRLQIGRGCEGGVATVASGPRPPVVSSVTIRMPASDPTIRAMRLDHERGARFREARDDLIRRAGLPRPSRRLAKFGYNAQDRAGKHELTVRDGVGEVTFQLGGVIYERRIQYLWPWIIKSADPGIIVRPSLRRSPPGSKKRVEVVSCVWKPVIASPSPPSDSEPTDGDRSSLAWDLEARRISSRPQVTLKAPLLDRWSLAGSGLAAALRFIASMLVPGVLLLLAFRRLAGSPVRLRIAAVIVALLMVTIAVVVIVLYGRNPIRTPVALAIGVGPLVLLLALYLSLAPPASIFGRVVIGIGIVAALTIMVWDAWVLPTPRMALPDGVVLALAVVLVALMAFALLTAALRAFAEGLGRPPSSWRRGWRLTAEGLIVVACIAQAGQFVLQRRTAWSLFGAVFEGDDLLRQDWLRNTNFGLIFQPFDLLVNSVPLLTVIVAGLALSALRSGAEQQAEAVTFTDARLRRLAMVLFVAVAVGSSAPLLGVPLPIAFAMSLGYLRWIRSSTVERAEEYARVKLGRTDTDDSILSEERPQLIARAAAVHRELRVEDQLQAKYGTGDTTVADEAALSTGLAAARKRLRALRRGGSNAKDAEPPLTVPLPQRAPPEAVALALGPTGDWWKNGVESIKLAWPLIAVPLVFSASVMIGDIIDRWSMAMLFQSPVGVVTNVVRETVFWMVSAFSLGALLAYLPFRNSPMKGLALASVYIVPLLALQVIAQVVDVLFEVGQPFQLEISDWSFRGFELVLVLMAVGVRLDSMSVRDSVARLVPLYGLDDVRYAIVYIAPVALTIVLVGGQLFRGDASSAVQTILENATNLVPSGGGIPGLGH